MTISDTQTGLRALPREAVEELVDVAGDRFEYETNMLLAFKEKAIPFEENKIRTVYIEENKSFPFTAHLVDSWRIYKLILAHFFRYTVNSIVCAAVDTGLFTLFTALLKKALEGFALTAAAGTGARVISSLLRTSSSTRSWCSRPTQTPVRPYFATTAWRSPRCCCRSC